MAAKISYRLVKEDDSQGLKGLIRATVDAGSSGFTDQYQADLLSVHRGLAEVFQVPLWLPMFKACYLVRTYDPLEVERLTFCIAGP
jgi:hypothetical protein